MSGRRVAIAVLAAAAVLAVGALRIAAIDRGALRGPPGAAVEVQGAVTTAPRPADGAVSFELDGRSGRVLVQSREFVEAEIGSIVKVSGRLAAPEPWLSGTLRRHGIAMAIEAERIEPTGERRGGLAGRIEAIRREIALAPLVRPFVGSSKVASRTTARGRSSAIVSRIRCS